MIWLKVTKFREGTMKPKKNTKYVSHQEHQGHKEHQNCLVYASGGLVTLFCWYMPPAAM